MTVDTDQHLKDAIDCLKRLEDARKTKTFLPRADPTFKIFNELNDLFKTLKNLVGSLEDKTPWQDVDGQFTEKAWKNWAGNLTLSTLEPLRQLVPKTRDDVVTIVKGALKDGKSVRCVGHGHSWTPVFYNQDIKDVAFIVTRDLQLPSGNRIELLPRERSDLPQHVRLAPGVTTGELSQWVDEQTWGKVSSGQPTCFSAIKQTIESFVTSKTSKVLGMPADVILNTVRYGGVVSCACHGAGQNVRTIPDRLVAMTIVNSKGEVQEFNKDSPHWDVVRASFGLTGVIVDLTFEMDDSWDAPYVDAQSIFPRMGDFITADRQQAAKNIEDRVKNYYAVEMFWFALNSIDLDAVLEPEAALKKWDPYNDDMWQIVFTRTAAARVKRYIDEPQPIEQLQSQLGAAATQFSQQTGDLRWQLFQAKLALEIIKIETTANFRDGSLKSGLKTLGAAIHYQKAIDFFAVEDFEMCFKVTDWGLAVDAWKIAVDTASDYVRKKGRNVMNVALECRFTRGSAVVMSPSYDGGTDDFYCWIEVLCGAYTPKEDWQAFTEDLFNKWKAIPGTVMKPHWAKWAITVEAGQPTQPHYMDKHVREVYSAQAEQLRAAIKDLDPTGLFRNDWLAGLLDITYSTRSAAPLRGDS